MTEEYVLLKNCILYYNRKLKKSDLVHQTVVHAGTGDGVVKRLEAALQLNSAK